LLVACLTAVLVVSGCGEAARSEAPPASRPTGHFRFFSPHSFWNRPIRGETTDAGSRPLVDRLAGEAEAEQEAEVGPWINTSSYSVPLVTVGRRQPNTQVRLASPYDEPGLRRAFAAVPLPADAEPAAGSDAHLVLWQPARDRLWEFWHLRRTAAGWKAGWGGAIRNVSDASGAYGSSAWPGATSLWGASASSLSIAGGLITFGDLARGSIDHALALSIPNVRARFYALPARRTDGVAAGPLSLPEGAHLRLRPDLDLAGLDLPPLTLMIAEAAQRYGIFVRDRAGTICFYAQAPRRGADPYNGPDGAFEGRTPRELLAGFPWRDLQVLPMRLRHFKRGETPAGRREART
jgi:hypothetical protein